MNELSFSPEFGHLSLEIILLQIPAAPFSEEK